MLRPAVNFKMTLQIVDVINLMTSLWCTKYDSRRTPSVSWRMCNSSVNSGGPGLQNKIRNFDEMKADFCIFYSKHKISLSTHHYFLFFGKVRSVRLKSSDDKLNNINSNQTLKRFVFKQNWLLKPVKVILTIKRFKSFQTLAFDL